MKIPRSLTIFFCVGTGALALAIAKALVVSGLDKLPPVKVLLFAASMFGLVAVMLDWLFRDMRKGTRARPSRFATVGSKISRADRKAPGNAVGWSEPVAAGERENQPQGKVPQIDSTVGGVRLRPIVFREIFPPFGTDGLSFYGGVPVGPADLIWPRVRNKPGDAPLSFIMQWDCAGLAAQDASGLLPSDGILYLFGDLTWGDPFDFQFIHAPGPVDGVQTMPIPPDLPPVYGDEGAYQVPYCSPRIAKANQDVPRLLPKWPFTPMAFFYPVPPNDVGGEFGDDQQGMFWSDSEAVGEALLLAQHPEGVPAARRRDERQQLPLARPFGSFPHDYAAVRVVAAKVLDHLHRPPSWLLREASIQEREAKFQAWRVEATRLYVSATAHSPTDRVEQSSSDDVWRWIEGLKLLVEPGWDRLVEECVNVSLGLRSEAASTLPAKLVATCGDRHKLAWDHLHEEYPDHSKPGALEGWKARKTAGSLKEVRSLHAPCPNHMFGPPSFVQGHVEEYLKEWVLLLELSSHEPIGINLGEGVLQFMIRPADLRERRFDRVMLVASAY